MVGLVIDTSSSFASVALINDGKVLFSEVNKFHNKQAESVNLMIENANKQLNTGFQNYKYVAVTIGPGKLTGLRVGVSIANALRFALSIPIITISNFDVIAYISGKANFAVVLEAGIKKFYFQEFRNYKSMSNIRLISSDEVLKYSEKHYLIGNVGNVHKNFLLNAQHIGEYINNMSTNKLKASNRLCYIKPQYFNIYP